MIKNRNSAALILIVEDDYAIARGIEDNLQIEGYKVEVAFDGEQGLEKAVDLQPDLILLDVMLPRMNGYEVVKELRRLNVITPVIMVTAKGEEFDRCLGLDLGADDYIVKPFSLKELFSRVSAQLRRVSLFQATNEVLAFDEVHVDFARREIKVKGVSQPVTATELAILKFLADRAGTFVSREQILDGVWGQNYFGTARTIDNFISSLRQKIGDDPKKPRYIKTVRGLGYTFSYKEVS